MVRLDFLEDVDAFGDLDDDQLTAIQECCEVAKFKRGETIFAAGQVPEYFWLVLDGEVNLIWDVLSWALLLTGGFFLLAGGIGLLRLPDFFTRLHAVSVTESLAAPLLITGIMLDTGWAIDSVKMVLLIVIMILANPTITHALCRAAAHGGKKPQGFEPLQHAHEQC